MLLFFLEYILPIVQVLWQYQGLIQNPFKHPRWFFFQNVEQPSVANYFQKRKYDNHFSPLELRHMLQAFNGRIFAGEKWQNLKQVEKFLTNDIFDAQNLLTNQFSNTS